MTHEIADALAALRARAGDLAAVVREWDAALGDLPEKPRHALRSAHARLSGALARVEALDPPVAPPRPRCGP